MSTYTISGAVTLGGSGLAGVTVTITRVSGTADAYSPYTLTSAVSTGDYSQASLVAGTVYSIVATDGALTFSTVANTPALSADLPNQNFTLTPTISVAPTSLSFAGADGQQAQLTSIVGNDIAGTTSWFSSNTAVATVASDGVVTVVGSGSVTITAKVTDDTAVTATCSISIGVALTVSLTAAHVNLLQSVLQEQLQEGYAVNPFTSGQSKLIISALAALRSAVK